MTPATFNTSGVQGRDCPICYRTGTLAGPRNGDSPRLTCTGCCTIFELTWASVPGMPDLLTRIGTPIPTMRREFELTPTRGAKR